MRTRVKICGITQTQDAVFAVKSGADAIGLVFYEPSPRSVTIAQAQKIVKEIGPFVTIVGLFVDAKADTVHSVLEQVSIDLLQFHGDESVKYCEQFHKPYIKAVRMKQDVNLAEMTKNYASASGLLLDTYQVGKPGGTGQTFDWSLVKDVEKPVILAGGLTPENVMSAIQQVSPYAVDVSGGVELEKGIKDKQKISAFMREVENA